jgi:y4mF family transcriptional regulator
MAMERRRIEGLAVRVLTLADLSRVIAEARVRRQLTQRQLAQLADVSQSWIVSVEAGKTRMEMAAVLRVLAALGLRITLQSSEDAATAAMTLEMSTDEQSAPSEAGLNAKPKQSTNRYVIEVRSAQGESLVLTTVEWTKDGRRDGIKQILRLAGFAKPAVDESPKGRSLAAKSGKA